MKNLIIAGSINMDIVVNLDRYPEKGETVYGKNLFFIPGGKGANQARQIARLGKKIILIGRVGPDGFGKTLIDSLIKDGVDTSEIKISSKSPSGTAIIGVDKKAENRIIITPGANFDLKWDDINHNFDSGDLALSHFEIPAQTVKYFFAQAKKAGATTILNPSPIQKMAPTLLKNVDYLIINEHEFAFLSKSKRVNISSPLLAETAKKLMSKNQVMIVTFGSKGSIAIQGNNFTKAESFRVKATDTTGAGDSFLGAFTVAIAEGKNLKEALTFANAAAALKVTKRGASSMPYRKEVETIIQKNL